MENLCQQATILLIGNNSDWQTDVDSELSAAGYKVLTATGGDQGFCVARRIRPSLIICEEVMPNISGTQLCYMIRADKYLHKVKFILMGESNSQDCNSASKAVCAGADECFEKDCSRQFLIAKIKLLIVHRQHEIELEQHHQNLRRSESRLLEIIEDFSDLLTSFELTPPLVEANKCSNSMFSNAFPRSLEQKKTTQKNSNLEIQRETPVQVFEVV